MSGQLSTPPAARATMNSSSMPGADPAAADAAAAEGSGAREVALNVAAPCFAALRGMWEAGEMCDVALRAGSGDDAVLLPAHTLVLAAVSPYFRALFLGAGLHMQRGGSFDCGSPGGGGGVAAALAALGPEELPTVELPSLEPRQLRAVLTAVYTQRLVVCVEDVQALLSCSEFLGIASVTDACCQCLADNMDVKSCLATLRLAAHFNLEALLKQTRAFVCAHFSKAVAADGAASQLAALPRDALLQLLTSETLQASSEQEVAEVAAAWLEAHPWSLQADAPELLRAIRLPPGQLRSEIESGEIHVQSAECRKALLDLLAGGGAALRLPPVSPRQKVPVTLIAAGGHDPSWHNLRNTELYLPKIDKWVAGPLLPQGYSFAAGAPLRSEAVILGGATHGTSVAALREGAWQALPSCGRPRLHAAAASCGGRLYVLGGRAVDGTTRSTEFLQQDSRRWQPGPDMVLPRTALAAASIQEALFAVGGQSGKAVHSCVERLDAGEGRFVRLAARMRAERKYTAACALNGRLIVVGGMDATRTRLASVEAFDPREGQWRTLPPMRQARASCGAAVLGGELFAVAGSGENDSILDTVECYSPTAGQWRSCRPLNLARSSLALLPLC